MTPAGSPPILVTADLKEWLYEELVVSRGHRKRPGGGYVDGGPFLAWRESVEHRNPLDLSFIRWGNAYRVRLLGVSPVTGKYGGGFPTPADLNASRPTYAHEALVAQAHGPAAYRKTAPGNPMTDLGQFIGELGSLPAIPGRQLLSFPRIRSLEGVPFRRWGIALRNRLQEFLHAQRQLGTRRFLRLANGTSRTVRPGSEYLNVVFGWQPFVRDFVSTFELSHRLRAELDKIVRENGKGVHRRTHLKRETTHVDSSAQGPWPGWAWEPFQFTKMGHLTPNGWGVVGKSTQTCVTKREERVWFAGKYRYWIPDVTDPWWEPRAIAALYGVFPITPSLLWELTPYSWLSDWFTTFGDVIANTSGASAVDNLVLEYGYIMRTVTETTTATEHVSLQSGNLPGYNEWPAVDHVFTSEFTHEKKSRAGFLPFFPGAQPWVFEPGANPFSGKQWAILTALALSQGFNR